MLYGPNVNAATVPDLYLDLPGATLGQIGSGEYMVSDAAPGMSSAAPYGAGHPLVWGFVIVAGFLFLGWLAHRLGKGEQYANTKVSAVTIIVAGAAAVLFIYTLKLVGVALNARFPQNGFSAFALSI